MPVVLFPFLFTCGQARGDAGAAEAAVAAPAPAASSPQQIVSPPEPSPGGQSLLVGVYVNGREWGAMTVQLRGGEIWMPWGEFLVLAGVQPSVGPDGMAAIGTSIGTIDFDTRALLRFNGVDHVSFRMLEERFRIQPSFSQPLFAVMLRIPWSPALPKNGSQARLKPDVTGPATSVAFIHAGYELATDFGDADTRRIEFESGGRVLGGVWDMGLEGASPDLVEPVRYHWTSLAPNAALRIGTGVAESCFLLTNRTFTGAQFGWSNRSILPYFDRPFSAAQDSFMTFNNDQRLAIEGKGPPAGIAELRFDGKVAARQLIRLDGRFRFTDVRMGSAYRKTEVYLYTRSFLEKPSAILDFTQSISTRAIESGTLLTHAGAGIEGNPAIRDGLGRRPAEPVAFGHLRYGVSRWLTTEAAFQHLGVVDGNEAVAGAVMSIGSSWNASAYGALSNGRHGTELSLERRGKRSELFLSSTSFQKGFRSDEQSELSRYWLNFSLRPWDTLNLSLTGERERDGEGAGAKEFSYLRPGLSFFLRPGVRFGIIPEHDEQGAYRYEASYSHPDGFFMDTSYSEDIVDATASLQVSKQVNVRLANKHALRTGGNSSSAYLDWYLTGARRSLVQLAGSRSGKQAGISVAYHRAAQAGLDFSVGYRYNMANALNLDVDVLETEATSSSRHNLAVSLSWEMGWSGRRFRPASRSTLTPTRGGIAGSIRFEDDTRLPSGKLDNVGILVNGKRLPHLHGDSSFFVGNLKPGLYRVTLDQREMPIELTSDAKGAIVEVKSCSITNIDIPVFAEYGVVGRVLDNRGEGLPDVPVLAWKEGRREPVGSTSTNQFGYYRLDGLKNGRYRLAAGGEVNGNPTPVTARTIEIHGDYQFDADLICR